MLPAVEYAESLRCQTFSSFSFPDARQVERVTVNVPPSRGSVQIATIGEKFFSTSHNFGHEVYIFGPNNLQLGSVYELIRPIQTANGLELTIQIPQAMAAGSERVHFRVLFPKLNQLIVNEGDVTLERIESSYLFCATTSENAKLVVGEGRVERQVVSVEEGAFDSRKLFAQAVEVMITGSTDATVFARKSLRVTRVAGATGQCIQKGPAKQELTR